MAVLLAFIDSSDNDATEVAWRSMLARAKPRACEVGVERRGPGWRAWAARATPGEPEPLVDLGRDGREPAAVLLLDRAIGDHDPADRGRGDWSSRRLFDGTPCASIRIDTDGRRLGLTRDVMGQRALVWADVGSGFVVASGEDILLGHPDVPRDLDLDWFAALIAGVSPDDDLSAYQSIRVLPSAAELTVVEDRRSITRQPLRPDPEAIRSGDAETVERFRGLVDRAVGRALRGVTRPAISLSGGLDSALVAESVARQWGGRKRPLAVAFGFDRWPAIDERALARAVAERLGFEFKAYAADELVPMRAGLDRPICPDSPYATPYREIKEAGYRIAADLGCDAVLSGNFGDHLHAHPARWLIDAVRLRRFDLVRSAWASAGFDGVLSDPGFRILARPWRLRWPASPPGLARLAKPWRDRLEQGWRVRLRSAKIWPRPSQALLCLDAAAAYDACGEDWYATRHGLAFRQPFRDPELTRFMLSLPAFHSTRGRLTKWLARSVLQGRLPPSVVDRGKGGDLTPFAEDADRTERARLDELADQARALVDPLLSPAGRRALGSGDMPWLLSTVALWLEATAGRVPRCV